MVLYLWSKFGVCKPWANIPWPRRFQLGFWQISKQIYRKVQYRENVFREFQALPRFSRKMVLYLLTNFDIIRPWTSIQTPRRFNLGFWQTSKQIYIKLEYSEKILGRFNVSLTFPQNCISISQPNLVFESLEPIFHGTQQIERKLQHNGTAFGDFQSFSGFSQKQFYICRLNLAF